MAKVFGSTGRTLGRTGSRNKGVFRTDFRGFATGWELPQPVGRVFSCDFQIFKGKDQGTNQRFGSNQKQTLIKMKHIHIIEELLSTNPLTSLDLKQNPQSLMIFGLDEDEDFGSPSQAPMVEKTLEKASQYVYIWTKGRFLGVWV